MSKASAHESGFISAGSFGSSHSFSQAQQKNGLCDGEGEGPPSSPAASCNSSIMLFTKNIETSSYQDVVEFCEQKQREMIHRNYKKGIGRSVVKTIATMANTWGGLIIIGVEEEDSALKVPVSGIPCEEHLWERISNRILGSVTPPCFPKFRCARRTTRRRRSS